MAKAGERDQPRHSHTAWPWEGLLRVSHSSSESIGYVLCNMATFYFYPKVFHLNTTTEKETTTGQSVQDTHAVLQGIQKHRKLLLGASGPGASFLPGNSPWPCAGSTHRAWLVLTETISPADDGSTAACNLEWGIGQLGPKVWVCLVRCSPQNSLPHWLSMLYGGKNISN